MNDLMMKPCGNRGPRPWIKRSLFLALAVAGTGAQIGYCADVDMAGQSELPSSELSAAHTLIPTNKASMAAIQNQAASSQGGHTASVTQQGAGNQASLTQSGQGNTSVAYQNGTGNAAVVGQYGSGNFSAVGQLGKGNTASVAQHTDSVQALIFQSGNFNQAGIDQQSAGAPPAMIIQHGNGTAAKLTQY